MFSGGRHTCIRVFSGGRHTCILVFSGGRHTCIRVFSGGRHTCILVFSGGRHTCIRVQCSVVAGTHVYVFNGGSALEKGTSENGAYQKNKCKNGKI